LRDLEWCGPKRKDGVEDIEPDLLFLMVHASLSE